MSLLLVVKSIMSWPISIRDLGLTDLFPPNFFSIHVSKCLDQTWNTRADISTSKMSEYCYTNVLGQL